MVLFIYRPDVFLTGALNYNITDKKTNRVLGKLSNNSYFNKSLPAGNYILKTDTNEVEIKIKKNRVTCIKSSVDIKQYPLYTIREFTLNKIDINRCQSEIRKTRKSI